ncbi:MAG TPA: hypothetical protein VIZ28_13765 [Chitinophagaceae bacterium]
MLCVFSVIAQENDSMYAKKDFLIILSTKNYQSALTMAKEVSVSTNIGLQLRGLIENKTSGLSFSKEECEKEDIEYPAYYARGRWDDGIYLSIEYSNAYSEFAKGYYIVVAASGSKDEEEIKIAYNKIKRTYKDAYFKSSKVYVGCMH